MYALVALLWCLFLTIDPTSATCHFNLDAALDSGRKNPIVLFNDEILQPTYRNGAVTLKYGQVIRLSCTGKNNYLLQSNSEPLVNATCSGNNKFTISSNYNRYTFDQFSCNKWPESETKINPRRCNRQAENIFIGFQVSPHNFISKLEVCFDPHRLITYWTKHKLEISQDSCLKVQTSFKKTHFSDGDRSINPDNAYLRNNVYQKGHLSPNCDFFTIAEKRMTFYYINTAPQIAEFNRDNWATLEGVIRTAISHNNKMLYIYTGTTDISGDLGGIPVPQYFWKVVIESSSKEGVAFVGVNNVKMNNIPNPCWPSSLRCDRVRWLGSFTLKMSNVTRGKIYCCSIEGLKLIPNIEVPAFSEYNRGLLLNI